LSSAPTVVSVIVVGTSSVDDEVETALPGPREKSRLPLVAYRSMVPIVECTNKYDMVSEH
jgi:hypothetical protein